jgi:hypothetical protein
MLCEKNQVPEMFFLTARRFCGGFSVRRIAGIARFLRGKQHFQCNPATVTIL